MNFRKEIKFRVSINEYHKFKSFLMFRGMKKLYDSRNVNSIYFDTKILDMFHNSEEGVLPRKKIRIRWYNNSKKFFLETKISSIEGRFKKISHLKELKNSDDASLYIPFDINLGFLNSTLLVSYQRSYFKLDHMRITFDQYINYKHLIKTNRYYKDPERVIEIKAPIGMSDNYIETLVPYSTSRFSKYSRGILMTESAILDV